MTNLLVRFAACIAHPVGIFNVIFAAQDRMTWLDYDPAAKELSIRDDWTQRYLSKQASLDQTIMGLQNDLAGQIGDPWQVCARGGAPPSHVCRSRQEGAMNVVPHARREVSPLVVPLRAAARNRGMGGRIAPYLFVAPFVLAFLVLLAIPVVYSLVLSLLRYRGYDTPRWVGFANYGRLLGYHQFWSSWANTLVYWIGGSVVTLAFAFLLAVLVHQGAITGKRIYKPVIFLPNVMAAVAASLIFQSIFATQSGVINTVIGKQLAWDQDEFLGKFAVILLRSWHGTGWFFVVFLAGLTTIDPELYDAARMDGARAWQSLRHITVPLMRPTLLFATVTITISSLRLFAEPNLLFSSGTAPPQFQPIMNQLYLNLQSGEFGAAAVAWLIFIPIVIVSAIQFRLLRGDGRGEGAES